MDDVENTDTSDEEELRSAVGNVPLHWYDDYPHIGYNLQGEKILKPAKGDELDGFLKQMDNPNFWRSVRDAVTHKEVVLNDEELNLIEKLQRSEFPETTDDPYEPYTDFFTHQKMDHPLSNFPRLKESFLPSLWQRKKVMRLVQALKKGWIQVDKESNKCKLYMLWNESDQPGLSKHRPNIPGPKVRLPGHMESYNPPAEYLPTTEEEETQLQAKPSERATGFVPTKYSCLRLVPGYNHFMQERFERCLDLYMCPRQRRAKVQIDPEVLIPKMPTSKEMEDFPSTVAIVFKGHTKVVTSISVDSHGQWLASVAADQTLRLWEVSTGHCMKVLPLPGKSSCLSFCPNNRLTLLAVAVGDCVYLINHRLGDRLVVVSTDNAFPRDSPKMSEMSQEQKIESDDMANSVIEQQYDCVSWTSCTANQSHQGMKICLKHSKSVSQVTWHFKGDYFATVVTGEGTSGVIIHQLSKQRSQVPFRSLRGLVQKVVFHPSKPFLFVATQTYIHVYNLAKQELTRKLLSGVKWISSMDVHPKGDNLIIGSYDKKVCWFDMDLSNKPYKILRHHHQAIRQVHFHSCYPLFASCSDDGSVVVCHGMVYSDLMQNPQIVPVKVLRGHTVVDGMGVTDCHFHPSQPWLFTAGADSTIRLYS